MFPCQVYFNFLSAFSYRIFKNASLSGDLYQHSFLKGQCHEIFSHFYLFIESKPSGPLINRINWFCLKVCFHGDTREKNRLESDSAQANTARSQPLHRLTLRGVGN